MARIVFDKGWESKLDAAISDFMGELADDVLHTMEATCPVDTGELLNDLAAEVQGKDARIGAKSVEHAIYVEEGVGPHRIEPNTKKALYWEGARQPVNAVNHPGTPATHFMKNALYQERA